MGFQGVSRRILATIVTTLLLLGHAHAGSPLLTSITGTVVGSQGSPFNGSLRVSFSYAGATDPTCAPAPCMVAPFTLTWPVTNGSLPSYAALPANFDIIPANTYYSATLLDAFLNPVETFNFIIPNPIGGTFDIGNAQLTNITTQNINMVSPASLTGTNTWTGGNSFNGPTTFFFAPTFNSGFIVGAGIGQFAAGFVVSAGTITILTPVALVSDTLNISGGAGSTLTINQHISNSGTALKHNRFSGCATSTVQFNQCTITVTWQGTAFANISYSPICTPEMNAGVAALGITAKTTTSLTVVMTNLLSGTAANVNLIDCIAMHD